MYQLNPPARAASADPYPASDYADLAAFYARRADLTATPLRSLPCFARSLGIAALHVKDESS
ncbi:MAG: diaminopropionate ammonia-lyase, partial [Steroidobacteraceae bacterium]